MKINIILMGFLLLTLTACGPKMVTKKEAFPLMYDEKPIALLVLPPINLTTAADAKDLYDSTIAVPLTLKGYYVLPIEATTEVLKAEGLPDTELLVDVPPQKFKEYFGADAVMFITINEWDTAYYVVGGNVTVAIAYEVKSTKTGATLWQYNDTLVMDTTGQNSGGGLAGLIIQAVETAVKTAMTDYVPIAGRLNSIALTNIPVGTYHPNQGVDMNEMVIEDKTKSM